MSAHANLGMCAVELMHVLIIFQLFIFHSPAHALTGSCTHSVTHLLIHFFKQKHVSVDLMLCWTCQQDWYEICTPAHCRQPVCSWCIDCSFIAAASWFGFGQALHMIYQPTWSAYLTVVAVVSAPVYIGILNH